MRLQSSANDVILAERREFFTEQLLRDDGNVVTSGYVYRVGFLGRQILARMEGDVCTTVDTHPFKYSTLLGPFRRDTQ